MSTDTIVRVACVLRRTPLVRYRTPMLSGISLHYILSSDRIYHLQLSEQSCKFTRITNVGVSVTGLS